MQRLNIILFVSRQACACRESCPLERNDGILIYCWSGRNVTEAETETEMVLFYYITICFLNYVKNTIYTVVKQDVMR